MFLFAADRAIYRFTRVNFFENHVWRFNNIVKAVFSTFAISCITNALPAISSVY